MSSSAGSDFRVGDVLSRGFSILSKNIVPFGVLALIFMSPTLIYNLASGTDPFDPTGAAAGVEFGSIAVNIAQILLTYVLTATLVYGTFQELRGRHTDLGDCVSRGLGVMFPILGVAIVAGLAVIVGSILLIIPGIIVAVMLWVAIPVAVVEKPGVFDSLGRSRELTKGFRWQVFGIIVIVLVIQIVAGVIIGVVLGFTGSTFLIVLFEYLVTAFFTALYAVISAVGYHDLRVAKEGIDVNQIAAVFD